MSDNQIVINDLSKVYDNGFDALKKVSLKVKQGEILAMLGPNGANNSLGKRIPTSKLLEKSGEGNIKKPPINPIIIDTYAVFSLIFLL